MCFVAAWRPSDTVQESANIGRVGEQVDSASNICWQFYAAKKFEY